MLKLDKILTAFWRANNDTSFLVDDRTFFDAPFLMNVFDKRA
jgi:hypothetical protein